METRAAIAGWLESAARPIMEPWRRVLLVGVGEGRVWQAGCAVESVVEQPSYGKEGLTSLHAAPSCRNRVPSCMKSLACCPCQAPPLTWEYPKYSMRSWPVWATTCSTMAGTSTSATSAHDQSQNAPSLSGLRLVWLRLKRLPAGECRRAERYECCAHSAPALSALLCLARSTQAPLPAGVRTSCVGNPHVEACLRKLECECAARAQQHPADARVHQRVLHERNWSRAAAAAGAPAIVAGACAAAAAAAAAVVGDSAMRYPEQPQDEAAGRGDKVLL
jgi:hypothetical protein